MANTQIRNSKDIQNVAEMSRAEHREMFNRSAVI